MCRLNKRRSLKHEDFGVGGLGLFGDVKGGGLRLVIDLPESLEAGNFEDVVEGHGFVDVGLDGDLADHVEVGAGGNFFLGEGSEFLVLKSHRDSVVHIGPLGNNVYLLAVLCVSLEERGGLNKVVEHKVALESTLRLGPAVA